MDGFTHQWPCSDTNNYLQVVRLRLDCDWSVVANSSLSSWLTSPHKLPQCSKQWNNTLHPAFTIPTQSHVWWWWSPQLRFQQGFTQIDLIWWIWKPSLHCREFTGCLYHSRLVERPILWFLLILHLIVWNCNKVCGTSSSAARTADTSDECATFRWKSISLN